MKRIINYFCILCMMLSIVSFDSHIVFAEENTANILSKDFVIENDVLVSYSGTDETVVIPEGIIEIGEQAFKANTTIKEVVFPSSLVKIGFYAFKDCINLTKANFPLNLAIIEMYAFYNTNIEHVFVPKSLTSVSILAFGACENIKSVKFEEGITTIPANLFWDSELFKNSDNKIIEIPSTVTEIGSSAFQNCSYLEGVVLPENIEEIDSGAFSGTAIKELVIPNDNCSIFSSFNDCDSLEKVTVKKPNIVENFRRVLWISGTFKDCDNLKSFELDNKNIYLRFDNNVFENCIRLENVDFPADGILSWGAHNEMFVGCSNLKVLNVPSTFTGIKSLELPNSTNVTIAGYSGSMAEEWAIEKGYTFNSLGDMISYINFDGIKITKPEYSEGSPVQGILRLSVGEEFKLTYDSNETTDTPYYYCYTTEDFYLENDTIVATHSSRSDYITKDNWNYYPCVSVKYGSTIMNIYIGVDNGPPYFISEEYVYLEGNSEWIQFRDHGYPVPNSDVEWKSLDTNVADIYVKDDLNCYIEKKGNGKTKIVATYKGQDCYCDVETVTHVDHISFNTSFVDLNVNDTLKLEPIFYPSNVSDSKLLTWDSSDKSIATVNDDGVINALKPGTATISATTSNGKITTCTITVKAPITSVVMDKSTSTINVGDTTTLIATINPSITTDSKTLTWTSSNTSVAFVDTNGKVVALAPGTTTITATTSNGKSTTCIITVKSPILGVNLNPASTTIKLWDTYVLTAEINPNNTTDSKDLTWTSSNMDVATVDGNGKVSAHSLGTATITVTTSNGKAAMCKVTVVAPVSNGWYQLNNNWYYYKNGNMVIGWLQLGSTWYYFNEDGTMVDETTVIGDQICIFESSGAWLGYKSGWEELEGTWYYYKEGKLTIGWLQIGSTWYYFSEDGTMVDETTVIGDQICLFNSSGEWLGYKSGWVETDGEWIYYKDGKLAKGWLQIAGIWYYFNEDGTMVDETTMIEDQICLFNASGAWLGYKSGWEEVEGTWYYYKEGRLSVGWLQIGSTWYYFNEEAKMLIGTYIINSVRYMFDESGAMVTGWYEYEGFWLYFNADGSAYDEGWLKSGNAWYYINEHATMVTEWYEVDGVMHYFGNDGIMKTGWQSIDNEWYYFNASGSMVTGWLQLGSTWYYFLEDGIMVDEDTVIDNVLNKFASSGVWLGY